MSWSSADLPVGRTAPLPPEGREDVSRLIRSGLIALGVVGALSLSACSGFTPVYGERGIAIERQAFQYAEPQTRLDQVIYQELVLRLGRSTDPGRPTVKITTSTRHRELTRSDVARPSEAREAVVTAQIEVTRADGTVLLKTTRSAAASYMTDSQALAVSEAEKAAYEQAAKSLADTIRLTLLGTLGQSGA
ncbi:LPS assembly lipoprotein LptE [Devosia sp.]|uniref:LPS assembly lipoprotein LptE n=1 Tax=Devosia sp. TaxID=1871048 RepID=UPI001AD1B31F|nr:LPS assembly lipoprotein LptE [Devosia sp.]MBN9309494.1 hypothetical protein [Devosia sp.]